MDPKLAISYGGTAMEETHKKGVANIISMGIAGRFCNHSSRELNRSLRSSSRTAGFDKIQNDKLPYGGVKHS